MIDLSGKHTVLCTCCWDWYSVLFYNWEADEVLYFVLQIVTLFKYNIWQAAVALSNFDENANIKKVTFLAYKTFPNVQKIKFLANKNFSRLRPLR